MIFIIIAVVLVIVGIAKMEEGWMGHEVGLVSGFFFVLAMLSIISGFLFGSQRTKPIDYIASSKLGSLQDNSQIHGQFFLGSGTIDEYPAYTYYKEVGPGQYIQRKIKDDPQSRPIVIFEDATDPRVDTIQSGNTSYFGWWGYFPGSDTTRQIEFHVPKGSVVNNVTLDAKD